MSEFKKIYYWAPFINKVATIKAVYNSVNSLNRYSPKKYRAKIIDSFGEWENNNYFNQNKEFFFSLTKISFLNRFSSFGFFRHGRNPDWIILTSELIFSEKRTVSNSG